MGTFPSRSLKCKGTPLVFPLLGSIEIHRAAKKHTSPTTPPMGFLRYYSDAGFWLDSGPKGHRTHYFIFCIRDLKCDLHKTQRKLDKCCIFRGKAPFSAKSVAFFQKGAPFPKWGIFLRNVAF